MSTPYQYWGKAAHMSADLKQVKHRVRSSRPEMFTSARRTGAPRFEGDKVVTPTEVGALASPMSGRNIHELARKK